VYKAPECFARDPRVSLKARTPASDIWAFGIIIVQVLWGLQPYEGKIGSEIICKRLKEGGGPFDVDDRTELRKMISACFNQAPEHRPSIGSVLKELKESHRLAVD